MIIAPPRLHLRGAPDAKPPPERGPTASLALPPTLPSLASGGRWVGQIDLVGDVERHGRDRRCVMTRALAGSSAPTELRALLP